MKPLKHCCAFGITLSHKLVWCVLAKKTFKTSGWKHCKKNVGIFIVRKIMQRLNLFLPNLPRIVRLGKSKIHDASKIIRYTAPWLDWFQGWRRFDGLRGDAWVVSHRRAGNSSWLGQGLHPRPNGGWWRCSSPCWLLKLSKVFAMHSFQQIEHWRNCLRR